MMTPIPPVLRAATLASAFVLLSAAAASHAQTTWPVRPVRVVVPFTPGSGTDIAARGVSERLGAALGQTFIVDNRPGAGGTIGVGAVAKANPDGHTVLIHSSSFTVTPFTFEKPPYDPIKDFIGISPVAQIPNVLVVPPQRGWKSVADLVAFGRSKPNALSFASAGIGTATQLNAELFRMRAGFEAVHVPFKGTPEALTEIMAGRLDFFFAPIATALPLIRDGKLQALAIAPPQRSAALPAVPTTVEAGVKNSSFVFWVGMFVPAGTPREVVVRLNRETQAALGSAEVKERFGPIGAEPMPMSLEAFAQFIRDDLLLAEKLVRAAGVKAN
jgi:tripartite-type tricarboxylate transporter receptor subunit TctC